MSDGERKGSCLACEVVGAMSPTTSIDEAWMMGLAMGQVVAGMGAPSFTEEGLCPKHRSMMQTNRFAAAEEPTL